ncbi:MAG: biotin--[acetyl-CoA-carboxylase] ligase [Desulfobulbus sp.]|nr:MAG: biotin--[acetyl-CoA-carboxylase] ligase [Desulfobulbus sp.]
MLSHGALCRLAAEKAEEADYPPEVRRQILRYGAPVGSSLTHYRQLPRCMDLLRRRVRNNTAPSPATGQVIRADELTASSGRFRRSWHAPVGGLYLALLWADTLLPDFSRQLPFAAGISCCETVREFISTARLQWVNDVRIEGKKICGILSETVPGARGEQFHVIGIGINVNTRRFPRQLKSTATSLYLETGKHVDLDGLCASLLARLQWNFGLVYYSEERFLAGARISGKEKSAVLRRWRELSDTLGRTVTYGYDVQTKPLYRATTVEIDDRGGLVMQLTDGSMITEYSGEISYDADS